MSNTVEELQEELEVLTAKWEARENRIRFLEAELAHKRHTLRVTERALIDCMVEFTEFKEECEG